MVFPQSCPPCSQLYRRVFRHAETDIPAVSIHSTCHPRLRSRACDPRGLVGHEKKKAPSGAEAAKLGARSTVGQPGHRERRMKQAVKLSLSVKRSLNNPWNNRKIVKRSFVCSCLFQEQTNQSCCRGGLTMVADLGHCEGVAEDSLCSYSIKSAHDVSSLLTIIFTHSSSLSERPLPGQKYSVQARF